MSEVKKLDTEPYLEQIRRKHTQQTESIDAYTATCLDCKKKDKIEELEPSEYLNGYTCADCKAKAINAWREKNIKTLMEKAGIPERYHAYEAEAPKNPFKGLFFSGDCGVGKTVKVCQIAKYYLLRGRKVRFYVCPDLIMQIQDTFSKNKSAYDLIKQVAEHDVLILDDLGAEKLTDYTRQLLYMLINEREMNNRHTIITSNFNLDDLGTLIDQRIASRIRGMCSCFTVKNKDLRDPKGGAASGSK